MIFIYGDESFLVEKKIKEILSENSGFALVELNSESKLNTIINEISSFSIFDQNRIIIVKNPYIFDKNQENDIDSLINATNFIPENSIVVFVYEKLIEKSQNKFIKFLIKNANCFECKKLNDQDLLNFVKKEISDKGGIISNTNLIHLLSKMPNKLTIINNEIEKLISYDKNITLSNIEDLVPKYETSHAFAFIEAFNNQDIEQIFKIYYEKIEQNESITTLISQITNVLDICSQIYSYKKMNFSNEAIAKQMQKHIYVIKKNQELLNAVGYKKIALYLKLLSQLDVNIKTTKLDPNIGFEYFLLNVARN